MSGTAILVTGYSDTPDRVISLERPMTIAEVIAAHDLQFKLPTIAVMGDKPVLRGEWNVRVVRECDIIAFVAVPGGGGGDGGGKQIVGLIAALALSVAAPMIGGWVAGSMFASGSMGYTIASSLVSGLVLLGGSLLLNMLFTPTKSVTNAQAEAVYTANAANNQATPFEPIPILYGRLRFPPRFASRPYAEFAGNDQYLYQLFAVTLGKADITRIEIGETEAWNSVDGYSPSFSDLEFEIVQPGDNITLFPANVVTSVEAANQTIPDPPAVVGPFVVNAAGTTIDRIAVDFTLPGGLFEYDDNGKIKAHAVSLQAQYRAIDNSGNPIGLWNDIFNESISRATRTPQRVSRSISVSAGRYEVQFFANTAFSTSDKVVSTVQWAGLRGYLTGFVTPPNCTLLAMKVRANEQLSQAASSQMKVTAERYLPVWDAGSADWVETKTRSIAWAAADILRNTDYSIGVPDTQYDLSELLRLDGVWEDRGDTFNALFDRQWLVYDALVATLRAGRAQPIRIGGKIGFVRMEPKLIKRAVFTTQSVVRGSFSHELILSNDENPDSVIAKYFDETVWDDREVRATLASIGSDAPARIEYFGITNHDQAWREAVTEAAINAYQREIVGFTSEWQGKLLVRGDPILVHHPWIEEVAGAAVVERVGDRITMDRVPEVSESVDAYLIIRSKRGREWGPCRIAEMHGAEIVLDSTERAAVEEQMGALGDQFSDALSMQTQLIICEGETRPFNGLVVSARPNGSDKVDIVAVIDAPEVYLADGTEVMPSPWQPPTLPPAVPLRPVVLGLFAELRAAPAALELDAMWQPAPGASSYLAEVSYDEGESWVTVHDGETNRFTATVLPQALRVRVSAFGTVQGPYVTRIFLEGEVPDILVPGQMLEGQVDLPALDNRLSGIVGTIFGDRAGTLASLIAAQQDRLEQLAASVARITARGETDKQEFRRDLRAVKGQAEATYNLVVTTVASEMAAFAEVIESLSASIGPQIEAAVQVERAARIEGDEAIAIIANEAAVLGELATGGGRFGVQALVGPGGASVKLDFVGRITTEDDFAEIGLAGVINYDGQGFESYMMYTADKHYFVGGSVVKQIVTIDAVNEELILRSLRAERIRSLESGGFDLNSDPVVVRFG